MELRTTRELRRNAQIDKSMRKKAETPDASAGVGAKPARTGALTDKMTLSQQAVEYIDRQREQLLRELAEHRAKQQGRWAEAQAPKEPADKLTLSRQAVAFVEEQSRKMWDEVREREQQRQSRMNAEPSSDELDLLSQGLKVLELCRKIAASIMKGDKVPPEDLKFLMENDPYGYRLAMALRRHKEDPEEVDSVLEDEENRNSGGEEASGGDAPSVEAAAPAGGGASASTMTE